MQFTRRRRWIQKAVDPKKRGSLHRQLGFPRCEMIPGDLLRAVKTAEPGQVVRASGKRVRITKLMKKRANLAVTLRRMKK